MSTGHLKINLKWLWGPNWPRQASSSHHQIVIWICFWFWDECHNPLRAAAESLMGLSENWLQLRFLDGLSLPRTLRFTWSTFGLVSFITKCLKTASKLRSTHSLCQILGNSALHLPNLGKFCSRSQGVVAAVSEKQILRRQCCLGAGPLRGYPTPFQLLE